MKEIKTCKSFNPKYPNFILVFTEDNKTYFLPEEVFTKIIIESGRKYKTLAPLSPYPESNLFNLLGAVSWKTNNQIYAYVIKQLEKYQKLYNFDY
ncbi:MAG: hypothetical protein JTT12_05695 [Candidatus Brockarchaeota archaeon]|nr:hypothetical protein [Candidatus Brockarchaeota archaeon]